MMASNKHADFRKTENFDRSKCYPEDVSKDKRKEEAEACNFIKKETLAQVFSFEFCEISKNTFSYRTPLVAASIRTLKSLMGIKHTKGKRSVAFKTTIKKNHNT